MGKEKLATRRLVLQNREQQRIIKTLRVDKRAEMGKTSDVCTREERMMLYVI